MEPPEAASTASTKPPRVASSTSSADRSSKLASLLASIDADLDAAAPVVENSGVDAFRRAKFFFPKVLEEKRRALEAREAAAAKKNKGKGKDTRDVLPSVRSSSPSRTADHDTKRRKVSYESHNSHDDDNADIEARLTAPRGGSRSSTSSPLNSPSRHDNRRSRSPTDSLSPSPPPRSRLDKGKGNATTHSVNAQVVYTNANTNANANSPPSKSTRQQTRSTRSTAKDPSVVVIDSTDDSDSDVDITPYRPPERRAAPIPTKKKEQEVAEAVDPEFAEYIQRARDKAAKARKEAEIEAVFGEADVSDAPAGLATFSSNTTATTNPTTASQATTASMGRSGSNLGLSDEQATPTEVQSITPPRATTTTTTVIPSSQPAPSDQQYRVFITSHLPQECPPLMAFMRMDQEMRYARNAYLSHATKHNVFLSDDEQQSVLLTWKGSKIYNFTTGQSLNVKPDHKGRFRDFSGTSSGEITTSTRSTAGFQNGGLHLEIWTQQLYDAYLEEEERRRRRNLGELVEELSDDDDDVAGGGNTQGQSRGTSQAPEAAAASSTRIRLVLASREYEKLKITAHSDTTVETLATAFRLQRGIEPDKTVAIMWDGDELENSMTVGEAEMEDLDSVEVYIR